MNGQTIAIAAYCLSMYVAAYFLIRRWNTSGSMLGRCYDHGEKLGSGISFLVSPIWAWAPTIYFALVGIGHLLGPKDKQ